MWRCTLAQQPSYANLSKCAHARCSRRANNIGTLWTHPGQTQSAITLRDLLLAPATHARLSIRGVFLHGGEHIPANFRT